jgi:phosphoglucosamine mutase
MAAKYFGTDGIRGRANGLITPELALKVGQAAGLIFRNGDYRHRVLIGKDTRLSGYMIELHARRPRRDDLGVTQSIRR